MASYVSYAPSSTIERALFNFDAFGIGLSNFRLTGTVRVSTSDSFSYADYLSPSYSAFIPELYTIGGEEVPWSSTDITNIQDILSIYSQFANITFQWVADYESYFNDTTANPEDVGRGNVSDINITWIYRHDVDFSGYSGGSADSNFGYTGAAGDIFLNAYGLSSLSLDLNTGARQTLMHEIGHSLGLSHPHTDYVNGVPTISADYAATKDLGFDELGFRTNSAMDMYKEFFSIMSYDDQLSFFGLLQTNAHTPMILDVIALQAAYGEGSGTTGAGNDTVQAGNAGYRTYFDKGGIDTVDLSLYADGAYFHMGTSILGAPHLVGVAMSLFDANNTVNSGGDPAHLRWFYGEFENVSASIQNDVIIGSSLANEIAGLDGNDYLTGDAGDDRISGGPGTDTLYGGTGNDLLDWDPAGRTGADTMYGEQGNDHYVFDSANDVAVELANEGTDTIWAELSFSLMNVAYVENLILIGSNPFNATGNAFDNVIVGNAGANVLRGEGGADFLDGGDGVDTVSYAGGASAVTVRFDLGYAIDSGGSIDNLQNIENVTASDHDDVLFAQIGIANALSGGLGDDRIFFDAADAISGGPGVDRAVVLGSTGVSLSLSDIEWLWGSNSSDVANASGQLVTVTMFGLGGADTLTGGSGADQLYGQDGPDTLVGGGGDDWLYIDSHDLTSGSVQGGNGSDRAASLDGSALSFNLGTASIEWVWASNLADNLDGTTQPSDVYLFAFAGADTLRGGSGNDNLYGMAGADSMYGGAGNDVLYFDSDDPVVDGGPGYDVAQVLDYTGVGVALNLATSQIEAVYASNQADTINASAATWAVYMNGYNGDDVMSGGSGADNIYGGGGADTISGGGGNDFLDAGGGPETDTLAVIGTQAQYILHYAGGALTSVQDLIGGRDGWDNVAGFEQVQFADHLAIL